MLTRLSTLSLLALSVLPSLNAYVVVDPNHLPHKSEKGQTGYNDCGTGASQTSECQTLWMNSIYDFCLWGPPKVGNVGDAEQIMVAYCNKIGHGTRIMPAGTIKGAHWVETPHYYQITGIGDFTKINVKKGDEGGELDPHGADGLGNPVGGLVLAEESNGTLVQRKEWTEFISDNEFCIRACKDTAEAQKYCQHIYDLQGCWWNIPGNYDSGFDRCAADDVIPMGLYPKTSNGHVTTSTWYQGVLPTPPAQPAAKTSQCHSIKVTQVNPGTMPTSK